MQFSYTDYRVLANNYLINRPDENNVPEEDRLSKYVPIPLGTVIAITSQNELSRIKLKSDSFVRFYRVLDVPRDGNCCIS